MNAFELALLALLALAARVFYLRVGLAGWERVWRFTSGPLTIELRRHAEMARFGNDSLAFPHPCECRILSMRIAGIPLWSQQAIVSLPSELDARIGDVVASEFDDLFTGHFRLDGAKRTVHPLVSLRH